MTKIAVIGAGLSGLSLAHLLQGRAQVTLFEKARGVSGRMSTRRADPYYFDHGAQYFTIRNKAFRSLLTPLLEKGIVERWMARCVTIDGRHGSARQGLKDDEPRYVGVPGMNAIAKHLAAPLDVRLNTRITSLDHNGTWQLQDEKGIGYTGFDWVIVTVPAPQASVLLPTSFQFHADISAISMHACFALMLGFSAPLPLEYEAAHITNSDISWVSVNSCKPAREAPFTLIVHSSAEYAQAHIDGDRAAVMHHLCAQTSQLIGHDVSTAEHQALHGWRYALNTPHDNDSVFLDQNLHLAACGDWCLGGRVENAFTAAYHLSEALKDRGI